MQTFQELSWQNYTKNLRRGNHYSWLKERSESQGRQMLPWTPQSEKSHLRAMAWTRWEPYLKRQVFSFFLLGGTEKVERTVFFSIQSHKYIAKTL